VGSWGSRRTGETPYGVGLFNDTISDDDSQTLQTFELAEGFEIPTRKLNMNPKLQTAKKRILAVDDKASNTRLVKLCLEQTDRYMVREENDARAAVSAAEEFEPHLILLDVMMPGMDGWDLVGCIQANRKLKSIPIVFLTAAITHVEIKASGGRVWGYPFLAKPLVLAELVACLQHHLGDVTARSGAGA
jgi:CheY-like chemotaxis protein